MQIDLSVIPTDELRLLISESVRQELSRFEKLITGIKAETLISDSETMTRKQLKEHLQCSYPTIDKMVREETIPHLRVGKKILFSKNEVLKALSPNSDQVKQKYGGRNVN